MGSVVSLRNEMTPLFLTMFLFVLVTADDQLEETEIVVEDRGVDERAEGLMARLEALKQIEEELVDFREESRGGLGGKILQREAIKLPVLDSEVSSSKGYVKAGETKGSGAVEILARLKAVKDSQEASLENSILGRKTEEKKGIQSGAKELLARLAAIKEQSRGSISQETSLDDLNLILSGGRMGLGKVKKQDEGRERLRELSATLDSLLFGRQTQGTGRVKSIRDRFSLERHRNLKAGHFKGPRELSTFEESTFGGLELSSLAEHVGQGGNVFLFLLSGSEKPQFSIQA